MINIDSIINENGKEHNENWPYIPYHTYRIIITGGSRSEKTNALHNLINEQNDIDKIYFYAKDLIEPKYEYLIKKLENTEIKQSNDPNAMIQMHLLIVQIRWIVFTRILMTITQGEK